MTFGVAYFAVRALLLILNAISARGDPHLLRTVVRIVPTGVLGPGLPDEIGVKKESAVQGSRCYRAVSR